MTTKPKSNKTLRWVAVIVLGMVLIGCAIYSLLLNGQGNSDNGDMDSSEVSNQVADYPGAVVIGGKSANYYQRSGKLDKWYRQISTPDNVSTVADYYVTELTQRGYIANEPAKRAVHAIKVEKASEQSALISARQPTYIKTTQEVKVEVYRRGDSPTVVKIEYTLGPP